MLDAIKAQSLRRRIRVEQKVSTIDSVGGEVITYTLRSVLSARVRYLTGRERVAAQQVTPFAEIEFLVRHRPDLLLTDRVLWKSVYYDVVHLDELGRNVGSRLLCKRPGGEGTLDE